MRGAAPAPPSSPSVAPAAFDAVAPHYDARFTNVPVARRLRARVWRLLDRCFAPGTRVLDVGCGTGTDAWHLAARGVRVIGVDPSAAMIDVARGRAGGVEGDAFAPGIAVERVGEARAAPRGSGGPAAECLAAPPATFGAPRFLVGTVPDLAARGELRPAAFDGALADFGALNAVPDLPELGRTLAALLRPGAPLVAVAMGPLCAWETAAYLARGDVRRAVRRWRGVAPADLGAGAFRVRYPSPRALAQALGPAYRLCRARGLGLVLPPTWVEGPTRWLEARPRRLDAADRLDALLCAAAPSAWAADHYVAVLERRA